MAKFLMLTTLTDEGRKTIMENPGRIKEVNKEVEAMGAKIRFSIHVVDSISSMRYPSNYRGIPCGKG